MLPFAQLGDLGGPLLFLFFMGYLVTPVTLLVWAARMIWRPFSIRQTLTFVAFVAFWLAALLKPEAFSRAAILLCVPPFWLLVEFLRSLSPGPPIDRQSSDETELPDRRDTN